jgi:hypothetical protein
VSVYSPVYLHFLDRELRIALAARTTVSEAEAAMRAAVIGTHAPLYAGISLAYESPLMTASMVTFTAGLVQHEILALVSSHHTVNEFMASRQALYRHDRERYPMYFSGDAGNVLQPTQYKLGGTTAALESMILDELGRMDLTQDTSVEDCGRPPRSVGALSDALKPLTEEALARREDRAITFALFSEVIPALLVDQASAGSLQRMISWKYCEHYLRYARGVLLTGVPGYSSLDLAHAQGFPYYDYPLLRLIIHRSGLGPLIDGRVAAQDGAWEEVLEAWGGVEHVHFAMCVHALLAAADGIEPSGTDHLYGRRATIGGHIQSWLSNGPQFGGTLGDRFVGAAEYLVGVLRHLEETGVAPMAGEAVPLGGGLRSLTGSSGPVEQVIIIGSIMTENLNIVHGNVSGSVIGSVQAERIDNSFNSFNDEHTADDELRQRLALLHEVVKGLVVQLGAESDSTSLEITDCLTSLTEEAGKAEPRKGVVRSLGVSIVAMAKQVSGTVIPVVEAVNSVLRALGVSVV